MIAFQAPILNGIESLVLKLVPDIKIPLAGGMILAGSPLELPSLRDLALKLFEKAKSPEGRRMALSILWVVSVVMLSLLSAVIIWVFHRFAGNSSVGIFITVALWALFFGICTLFFIAQKLITTIFGTLLGATASDLSSGVGLITKAHASVKGMADQIILIFKDSGNASPALVAQCVWIFILIYMLLCFPAFLRSEK